MPIIGGCLCLDLPTGTKIIGVVYLVIGLINSLFLTVANIILWGMGLAHQMLDMLSQIFDDSEGIDGLNDDERSGRVLGDEEHPELEKQREQMKEVVEMLRRNLAIFQVFMIVLLCLAILSVITSSMLIHGVRKRCRGLLVPWVVQEFLHIILGISVIVFSFVIFGSVQYTWVNAIPMFCIMLVEVFFIVVVISQFQALELIRIQDDMCMK